MQITMKVERPHNNVKKPDHNVKALTIRADLLQISDHTSKETGINSQRSIHDRAQLRQGSAHGVERSCVKSNAVHGIETATTQNNT